MIDKVFLDITKFCNAECKYCFTNAVHYNNEITNEELNIDEIVIFLNELVKNEIYKVSIGGGEPFLKNLGEIINRTNEKMKFSITTNGSMLSDEFIKLFIKNKNIKITISIDSLDNDKSNMIRKNIDINKVIENIKKLCKYEEIRERLSIRTNISTINYRDIYDIIKFCEDNKIKNLKVNSTNEFGRAKDNKELILPFKEFMNLLEELVNYCDQNIKSVNVELPVEKYLKVINRKCLCGNTSLYVNWHGDVYPCAFTEGELKLGNIREKKIDIILKEIKNFTHDNEFCYKCPINRYKDYEKMTKEVIK